MSTATVKTSAGTAAGGWCPPGPSGRCRRRHCGHAAASRDRAGAGRSAARTAACRPDAVANRSATTHSVAGSTPNPQVPAAHLDVAVQLGLRRRARLPGDDAVAARVDGRRRHLKRPGHLRARRHAAARMRAGPAAVDAVGPALPRIVERERAAERDHLPDEVRTLAGELAAEDAAQAPADHRDGPARALRQAVERGGHAVERPCGGADVAPEGPAGDVVPEAAQDAAQRHGAGVGGHEAGQDEHPVRCSARRTGQQRSQRGELTEPPRTARRLGQQEAERRARDRAGRVGRSNHPPSHS